MSRDSLTKVYAYHDGTKHHFHRFAQSLGYLDWASQPRPFRSFVDAPAVPLFPSPDAPERNVTWSPPGYDRLFAPAPAWGAAVTATSIGYVLRHALGLSAWKAIGTARWSLRVNPSSGNLHPTEAYVVTGGLDGLSELPSVWHYAPDRHMFEQRCAMSDDVWPTLGVGAPRESFLVGLTSIHWRESWKYGERAFRYCQHDLGHAIAALGFAAALCGWRVRMLSGWSHQTIAAMTGVDRTDDYVDAEREEPACALWVTAGGTGDAQPDVAGLLEGLAGGLWHGRASQLSEEHVAWTFIDEVAKATEDFGRSHVAVVARQSTPHVLPDRHLAAEAVILRRRSAVAFDGMSIIERGVCLNMLTRVMPAMGAPWDALWWSPRIHLAVFVHRVAGLRSGLYLLVRDTAVRPRLQASLRPDFLWEKVADDVPLYLLEPGDFRARARRLSCDQDIAADGCCSIGMIAEFDASLRAEGPAFYRQLFWESGVVGQVLYLEAEAAGVRATGIGCFYDDAVHELLALEGHTFQSLYHFTIGAPVEDRRLTVEPGYEWESAASLHAR